MVLERDLIIFLDHLLVSRSLGHTSTCLVFKNTEIVDNNPFLGVRTLRLVVCKLLAQSHSAVRYSSDSSGE